MKVRTFENTNPLMLFWIGVLTGALIVALVFMYKQNSMLQNNTFPPGGQMQPKMQTPKLQMTKMPVKINPVNGSKAAPQPQPY